MRAWMLGLAMTLVACGDEGEDSKVTPTPDTSATEDISQGDTHAGDTHSGNDANVGSDSDTSTLPNTCSHVCETYHPETDLRATFQQFLSGLTPVLTGGHLMAGEWVLSRVDLHPNGTFADGFTVSIDNAGATSGKVRIDDATWDLGLRLNLKVSVSAFGESGEGTSDQWVALGGCFKAEGAKLTGDFKGCAEGFVDAAAIPQHVDYEIGADHSELSLGLALSREGLLGLLPEAQREGASYAIQGGMYLRARFEKR